MPHASNPLYISQKRKAALLGHRPAFYGPTDRDALKWDKSMEGEAIEVPEDANLRH